MKRDFKGVWIPKELWLDKTLKPTQKFFLLEIDSLDNDERGCYASNKHFSELFGITKGRCTQIVKELEEKKLITIEIKREGKVISMRVIRVVNKLNTLVKKLNRGSEKTKHGYLENAQENNTIINNTKSNKEAFEVFWLEYPNKKNKSQALKSWLRISDIDRKLAKLKLPEFLAGLPEFQLPLKLHAATYLNNSRWEDESNEQKIETQSSAQVHGVLS